MRRLLLIAALPLAVSPASGFDSETPRLKREIVIASDLVRIGDLVENAGSLAPIAIFRAPDLGQTGTVQARRVVDAVLVHGLLTVDTGGVSEVTVIRASRPFARAQIEERIARALAGQNGLGEARDLSLTFDRDVRAFHAEPSTDSDLEATRVFYDPRSGRFDVTLDVQGSAAARRTALRYTGAVAETAPVLVLTRGLARGDLLTEDAVVIERRPKAGLGEAVTKRERAIGFAVRRTLRAGDPLRPADLMKPELVQRNEPVLIVFEAPGIIITLRGKAIDSGAEGDLVNVLNPQSKRALSGVVTGLGRVSIVAPQVLQTADITASTAPPPRPRPKSE